MNTNFKVIGLTRLGIKPKSKASEADALTTRPFELSITFTSGEELAKGVIPKQLHHSSTTILMKRETNRSRSRLPGLLNQTP